MRLTRRQLNKINEIAAAEANLLNSSVAERYKSLARGHNAETVSEGIDVTSVDKRIVMEDIDNMLYDEVEVLVADLIAKVSSKASRVIAKSMSTNAMVTDVRVYPEDIKMLADESDSLDDTHFETAADIRDCIGKYIEKYVEEVLATYDGHTR